MLLYSAIYNHSVSPDQTCIKQKFSYFPIIIFINVFHVLMVKYKVMTKKTVFVILRGIALKKSKMKPL